MTTDPDLKQELKSYLDSQIEEKVKSIQIEYLKEHFLTKQEFLDAMERLDKRFDAMQEQIDRRFENVYERFEQMDFGHTDIVEGIAYIIIKRELEYNFPVL